MFTYVFKMIEKEEITNASELVREMHTHMLVLGTVHKHL